MNFKLFGFFTVFLTSLQSLFAADNFIVNSLVNTLGAKKGLGALLFDENALIVVYFIVILLSVQSIFKSLLGVIKFDEKAAKTIAWMFSFIGTSGIFYVFGVKNLIMNFGGFFGGIVILVFLLSVIWPIIKNIWENTQMSKSKKFFWVISAILVMILLLGAFIKESGSFEDVSFFISNLIGFLFPIWFILLIAIFFGMFKLNKGRNLRKSKLNEPNNIKLKAAKEDLLDIDVSMRKLEDELTSLGSLAHGGGKN